jgi:hypothetical protein
MRKSRFFFSVAYCLHTGIYANATDMIYGCAIFWVPDKKAPPRHFDITLAGTESRYKNPSSNEHPSNPSRPVDVTLKKWLISTEKRCYDYKMNTWQ